MTGNNIGHQTEKSVFYETENEKSMSDFKDGEWLHGNDSDHHIQLEEKEIGAGRPLEVTSTMTI